MDNTLILEPLKYYEKKAKPELQKNISEYFNSLVVQSGVDEAANRETVKKYKKEMATVKHLKERISKYKLVSVLMIILAVLGGIGIIAGIAVAVKSSILAGLITVGVGIIALTVGILVNVKKIRPLIKQNEDLLNSHTRMAQALYDEAMAQMAPLNALFDDDATYKIIEKTMPELKFDRRFTPLRREMMSDDFDYLDFSDNEMSAVDTVSGTLFKNPFLFERQKRMIMGTFTYRGTLTIHWTETYRDSNGKIRTQTHSQVLQASLEKPKPYYKLETHLGYGSLAAPNLSFSRRGTHIEDLSEKERDRKVDKGSKRLQKKARKALAKGGKFQEMLNNEFDVLFGATDRTNEVEFRLMYTPLAQQNTLALITTETGYGDDFDFIKQKRYNIIKSEHAQNWQMHISAANYRSFDIDDARRRFAEFNEEFFKSVFFDFAPLMSVPVYQEEPLNSLKTPEAFKANYTPYEHEVMANSIGENVFKHPNAVTESILKTKTVRSDGTVDFVNVTSHSFTEAPRLDFVPVFGGDGRMHNVPVHWFEYIPVERTSQIAVSALDQTERIFNQKCDHIPLPQNSAYKHGLLAYTVSENANSSDIKEIFNKYL